MPIRSSRGRLGAYRAIWQWPLRSPFHLAVFVLVVGAVVVGLVMLGGRGDGTATAGGGLQQPDDPYASQSAPSSGISATPTPTMLPPVAELTPTTLPPAKAPKAALDTARQWAAAWVRHPQGVTPQQWLAGLRPYTTDEFLGVLGGVDPSNIPATKVTGAATPTKASPKSVQVTVPTDAVTLSIQVVDTDAGWRVSRYDRA
ncbi:hypothetical protein [Pseudonocardia phyllosphaerae]|uniref:hypothetical protein n=1 Tax=Pseudonocardia phyllosphaerae TaxID=3390502 RepID=UPI00397E3927